MDRYDILLGKIPKPVDPGTIIAQEPTDPKKLKTPEDLAGTFSRGVGPGVFVRPEDLHPLWGEQGAIGVQGEQGSRLESTPNTIPNPFYAMMTDSTARFEVRIQGRTIADSPITAPDPMEDQHVATKAYVDRLFQQVTTRGFRPDWVLLDRNPISFFCQIKSFLKRIFKIKIRDRQTKGIHVVQWPRT